MAQSERAQRRSASPHGVDNSDAVLGCEGVLGEVELLYYAKYTITKYAILCYTSSGVRAFSERSSSRRKLRSGDSTPPPWYGMGTVRRDAVVVMSRV